jgi:hypothetical protein
MGNDQAPGNNNQAITTDPAHHRNALHRGTYVDWVLTTSYFTGIPQPE